MRCRYRPRRQRARSAPPGSGAAPAAEVLLPDADEGEQGGDVAPPWGVQEVLVHIAAAAQDGQQRLAKRHARLAALARQLPAHDQPRGHIAKAHPIFIGGKF